MKWQPAARVCKQCAAPVIEGSRFCHRCGRAMEGLHSAAPNDTVPARKLTDAEVKEAKTQLDSGGYYGSRESGGSWGGSWSGSARTLTPVDMLSIQHAIDCYEKQFPHGPSPSAEVALAWLASRRGYPGWRRGVASQVERLKTLLQHDRSVAAAPELQPTPGQTHRHARRHLVVLAGAAIIVVFAAAVITSFHTKHGQGSSAPSFRPHARQQASLTSGAQEDETSAAIAARSPHAGRAAPSSASQEQGSSSLRSPSILVSHDQAGVPDVAVPQSDNSPEILRTLNGWAMAMNDNDIRLQMQYYSEQLDRYFLARNVSQNLLLQDKARFYRTGHYILAFHIRDVTVNKQSADQATVSLIKHWEIFALSGTRSGETRSRLWLARRGNQWIITGEQDLANLQADQSEQVPRTSSDVSF